MAEPKIGMDLITKILALGMMALGSLVSYTFYGHIDLQAEFNAFKAEQGEHKKQVEEELGNLWKNHNEDLQKQYDANDVFLKHLIDEEKEWKNYYKDKYNNTQH